MTEQANKTLNEEKNQKAKNQEIKNQKTENDSAELLKRMIRNVLGVSTRILDLETEAGQAETTEFLEKLRFLPDRQPLLSLPNLAKHAWELKEGQVRIFRDSFGICFALFLIHDFGENQNPNMGTDGWEENKKSQIHGKETFFLVGPWVQKLWSEREAMTVCAHLGLPASYLTPLSIYYHRFPLVDEKAPSHVIGASIRTVYPQYLDIICETVEPPLEKEEDVIPQYEKNNELQITVEEQYRLENLFCQAIREGDEKKALETMEMMRREPSQISAMNSSLVSAVSSASTLRTLCRKSAEEGGLPLIRVDAIAVAYAQKMYSLTSGVEIRSVITQMIRDFARAVKEAQSTGKTAPVRKVANLLRVNLNQNFTLEELAAEAGMTPNYLTQRFKEETGKTIFEYQANLRIKKACQLLSETNLPIQTLAAFVGYLDNNYFVKVFKKQMGITPSEYRKRGGH